MPDMIKPTWANQQDIDGFYYYREAISAMLSTIEDPSGIIAGGFSEEDLSEALTYCEAQIDRLQDDQEPRDPDQRHILKLFTSISERRMKAAKEEYDN